MEERDTSAFYISIMTFHIMTPDDDGDGNDDGRKGRRTEMHTGPRNIPRDAQASCVNSEN